jgi:hypothetical protein
MEVQIVRILKLSAVMLLASVTLVSAALAGGGHCSQQASTCTAKQTAACGAASMANCNIEAVRLSSGDLVVHYTGTTPEAIAYLHAKAEGSADKFCCPMTQKMAANESCKVDVSQVSNGVIVFVTSPKKEVVDAYEKEFAALTVPASK